MSRTLALLRTSASGLAIRLLICALFTTIAIPAAAEPVSATGRLNAIMATERKVNITHDPIPALDWPGMTMDFRLADTASVEGIEVGSRVAFQLRKGSDGAYEIESLKPLQE